MINLIGWWISRLGSSRRVLVYSARTQFQQLEFWNNFVISVRKRQRFAWGIDTSRWQTMMSVMMMMMMTALLCRHIYTVNSQTVRAFFVLFCFVSLQETDRTPCLQRKKKMYACAVCEWVGLLYTPCRPGALLRPPPPPYLTQQCHLAFLPKATHSAIKFFDEGEKPKCLKFDWQTVLPSSASDVFLCFVLVTNCLHDKLELTNECQYRQCCSTFLMIHGLFSEEMQPLNATESRSLL